MDNIFCTEFDCDKTSRMELKFYSVQQPKLACWLLVMIEDYIWFVKSFNSYFEKIFIFNFVLCESCESRGQLSPFIIFRL